MSEIGNFIWRHKTKVTGALIVALGAVQAQALLLQPLLSPKSYAYLMMGTGIVVSVLGFLNTPSTDDNV